MRLIFTFSVKAAPAFTAAASAAAISATAAAAPTAAVADFAAAAATSGTATASAAADAWLALNPGRSDGYHFLIYLFIWPYLIH